AAPRSAWHGGCRRGSGRGKGRFAAVRIRARRASAALVAHVDAGVGGFGTGSVDGVVGGEEEEGEQPDGDERKRCRHHDGALVRLEWRTDVELPGNLDLVAAGGRCGDDVER